MTEDAVFNAPWDRTLTLLTACLSLLMLGTSGLAIWAALTRMSSAAGRTALYAGAVVPIVAFAAAALLAPRGYAVAGGRLTIRRPLGSIEIPVSSIRAVETLPAERLAGSWRTLASGGLFGYYGSFRNRTLGDYRMYATRGDGYVLIRADRTYVLTPEAPDRFIQALGRGGASGPGGAGR